MSATEVVKLDPDDNHGGCAYCFFPATHQVVKTGAKVCRAHAMRQPEPKK